MPLELQSLTRRFGREVALDGVSLSVREGDCYGLIGHNGAGKTTLLRIVLGLGPADAGRVLVDGFDARAHPREARARLGGLIEVPGFYGGLDGRRNLVLLARLQGLARQEARREADRLLELCGIAHAAERPVQGWSQGMRQRLGIAQALLGRPAYVLLDEPTNGLDPQGMAELREVLRALTRDEGLTVVISSHQLHELADLCNRVAVLHRGRRLLEEETRVLLGGGKHRYRVGTDDDEAAARLLSARGLAPERRGGALVVDLGTLAPGDAARALVEGGRALARFAPEQVTLEEIYLAHARGEAHTSAAATGAAATPATSAEPAERRAPGWPVLRALRHELLRLAVSPGIALLFAAPCVLAALAVVRRRAEALADQQGLDDETLFSATAVTGFEGMGVALSAGLPLLALVLAGCASQALAGELARGTLRNLVLRPVLRWQLLLGKTLAALVLGALAYGALVLVAFAAASLAFDFKGVIEILPGGQEFPLVPESELWPALRAALRSQLAPLAAFAGIGMLAGALARTGVGGLALALALVLGLDLARGLARSYDAEGWLPSAYVPSPLGDTSFLHYYSDVAVAVSNASFDYGATALSVPLAWLLGALALSALIFHRRSIP